MYLESEKGPFVAKKSIRRKMFKPNSLFYVDGYKVGHFRMLAPGTTKLYGSWIPRSLKHGPKGVEKVVSFGQQLSIKWINDEFEENFFKLEYPEAMKFAKDMSLYLGMEYNGEHFGKLWDLGYLPIRIKSLPEGLETPTNIPHMTFVNTIDGFAWLTLYLETIISNLSWKSSTAATIAIQYKRNATEWVRKTDKSTEWLIPFMCHDFSARGLSGPYDMLAVGLGHATSFRGSDSVICIPGARYFYNEPENEVCINSVNASEHSVSTTKIFTVGEKQMLSDWMKEFPKGILSVVSDTFDLWKLITEYLPALKGEILAREGKLVIRPDSGDPVDIICGALKTSQGYPVGNTDRKSLAPQYKGVIELLWDIFGGTINEQGYKVLDLHIGAIYGDSINLERQVEIYERLAAKGFAATNIILGVGSFTYQYNTRDTLGWAAKGCWFEVNHDCICGANQASDFDCYGTCGKESFNIYKDPVTDNGTKKSLKGLLSVGRNKITNEIECYQECTPEVEKLGMLQVIFEDGKFYNTTTLTEIRKRLE